MPPKKKSSTPAKKPSAKKTATKKPTTTLKAKAKTSKTTSTRQKSGESGKPASTVKNTTKSSGKSTTKPRTRKNPESKLKRKKLPPEEMHPFTAFPYRLEYKDGNDIRICHFECEEHRDKHIKRYGLRKNQYFSDNLT